MRTRIFSVFLVFFSLPEAEAFFLPSIYMQIDHIQTDRLHIHSSQTSNENTSDNNGNSTSSNISKTESDSLLTIELHGFGGRDIDSTLPYVKAFSGLNILKTQSSSPRVTQYDSKEKPFILTVQYQYPIEQLVFLLEKVCLDLQIQCSLQSNENTILVVFITSQQSESLPFGVW